MPNNSLKRIHQRIIHANLLHAVSEASFQNRVGRFRERISKPKDHEFIVEMAGIVAMIQDGHKTVEGGMQFLTGSISSSPPCS